jgi:cell division protein FtsX
VVAASAGDISLVSVRNKDFKVVKVIDDQKSLQQFEKAWKEKKKIKNTPYPNWVVIDLEHKKLSW